MLRSSVSNFLTSENFTMLRTEGKATNKATAFKTDLFITIYILCYGFVQCYEDLHISDLCIVMGMHTQSQSEKSITQLFCENITHIVLFSFSICQRTNRRNTLRIPATFTNDIQIYKRNLILQIAIQCNKGTFWLTVYRHDVRCVMDFLFLILKVYYSRLYVECVMKIAYQQRYTIVDFL
jgi:hypothetical protein